MTARRPSLQPLSCWALVVWTCWLRVGAGALEQAGDLEGAAGVEAFSSVLILPAKQNTVIKINCQKHECWSRQTSFADVETEHVSGQWCSNSHWWFCCSGTSSWWSHRSRVHLSTFLYWEDKSFSATGLWTDIWKLGKLDPDSANTVNIDLWVQTKRSGTERFDYKFRYRDLYSLNFKTFPQTVNQNSDRNSHINRKLGPES